MPLLMFSLKFKQSPFAPNINTLSTELQSRGYLNPVAYEITHWFLERTILGSSVNSNTGMQVHLADWTFDSAKINY